MTKEEILNRTIAGLTEIPRSKGGKEVFSYIHEIQTALQLAQDIRFSENKEEMEKNYQIFREDIDMCIKFRK